MKSSNGYKVGSVSDILAQSCATSPSTFDKNLVDIFSSNKYKSKPVAANTRQVTKTSVKKAEKKLFSSGLEESPNPKKNKKNSLSHKDAAAIRVQAKRKIKSEVKEEEQDEDDGGEDLNESIEKSSKKSKKRLSKDQSVEPKKKKKKLSLAVENSVPDKSTEVEGQGAEKDDENESSSQLQSTNKKNKKLTKKSKSKDLKEKKKTKLKGKKFQGEAQNQDIIDAFEREQNNSDASIESDKEDDDEDDESNVKKDEEEKSKKKRNVELNAPKEKNLEHEARTVFVGNVPVNTKDKELHKIFASCGKIEAIRLRGGVPEKVYQLKKVAINSKKLNPNQYNMIAYIRFSKREEADKAVTELNGHLFKEHILVVDNADRSSRDNKKAVFIGNIPLKIKDDEVYKFFKDCGKIDSVRIIRDNLTGLSRGFGYVNFRESDSVEVALKKDGASLEGRQIRVSKAVKKEKKPKVVPGQNRGNLNNKGNTKQGGRFSGAFGRLQKKKKKNENQAASNEFTGDKLAERGTLKRKSSKPDRGALKKARIASQLTGVSSTQFKKQNEKKKQKSFKKK